MLEREIIPLFYQHNAEGFSTGWVKAIKKSITRITPHYTMKRQLDDYYDKFYCKEANRFHLLSENDNAKAKELSAWKENIVSVWDQIKVTEFHVSEDTSNTSITSGKNYTLTVKIDEQGLDDAIGVEMVVLTSNEKGEDILYKVSPFMVTERNGNIFTFQLQGSIEDTGSFKIAYRLFPKHPMLAHRQDFCYVTWFNKPE